MSAFISLVRRHPQVTFWLIAWITSFFGFFMRSLYPSDLWLLFIYGSCLGGALVTGIVDGRTGLRTYLKRIIKVRVGVQWYAIALLLPLALRLAATGLNLASGAHLVANPRIPDVGEIIFGFLFILVVIALGEEPGFRGFALPRLLTGRSALAASLILGVLHTVWHLPLFLTGEDSVVIIAIIISGAVLNTWLFNRTNGSVFIAMFLHASVNLWVDVFNPMFAGDDVARLTVWLAVVYVVMAVLLPLITGIELGRRPQEPTDAAAATSTAAPV